MTNLRLIQPCQIHREDWYRIQEEIKKADEEGVPFCLTLDLEDFEDYLKRTKEISKGINLSGRVISDTYFLVGEDPEYILGTINLRYELNESLKKNGGHIGYVVRPSERKKGYASKMLSLALQICKDKKLEKVLLTCRKNNKASAATILSNGGIFESEILFNGHSVYRYWITLI